MDIASEYTTRPSQRYEDEVLVGTPDYRGHAYFWHYTYRHYLRDLGGCPPGVPEGRYNSLLWQMRRTVHRELLRLGVPLSARSPDHETVVRYHRLQTERRLAVEIDKVGGTR